MLNTQTGFEPAVFEPPEEGVLRGHVLGRCVHTRHRTHNLSPGLESLGQMLSDELLWSKIHQYLAERGPIMCWILVRSESYVAKVCHHDQAPSEPVVQEKDPMYYTKNMGFRSLSLVKVRN